MPHWFKGYLIPHLRGHNLVVVLHWQIPRRVKKILKNTKTTFILNRNFVFMEQHFLQFQGIAMGISCPFLHKSLPRGWERMVFSEDCYTTYLNHVLCWYRFIDDVFLIWTGFKEFLIEFIQQLNINDLNLYFTFILDPKHIPFLDLMIIKHPDGTLATDLYRNPQPVTLCCMLLVHTQDPLSVAFLKRNFSDCAEIAQRKEISIQKLMPYASTSF